MEAQFNLRLDLDAPELDAARFRAVAGHLPPCPALSPDRTGTGEWPRLALCILLSLAAHCAMLAMPDGATAPAPPLVMELSLGAGTGSGDGKPAGGGQGPAPAGQASPPGELTRPLPPETAQPPVMAARTPETPAPALPRKTAAPRRKAVSVTRTPAAAPAPQPVPPAAEGPPEPAPEARDASASGQSAAGGAEGGGGSGGNAGPGAGDGGNSQGGVAGGTGTGGGDGAPLTFGEVGAPSFSFREQPAYPRQAVARKEQGTVTLLIHLDERGQLLGVEIAASAGPRLDEAALEAVRASSYRPAVKDGRGIPCRALLHMRFALRG